MTDLTEQWKKGELPEGFYYVNDGAEVTVDYYLCDYWERHFDSDVKQVLAPVPGYEEWQLMQDDNKRLKHDVGNLGYKIKNQRHEIDNRLKEIDKLKELLREIRDSIAESQLKLTPEGFKLITEIVTKIDEALK